MHHMPFTYSAACLQSRLAQRLPSRIMRALPARIAAISGGDPAAHGFKSATRRFVVEQDARAGVESIRFAVITSQLVTSDFADSVRRLWVEPRGFLLRCRFGFPEHAAATGKKEPAARYVLAPGREHEMRAVDVGVDCRKLLIEC